MYKTVLKIAGLFVVIASMFTGLIHAQEIKELTWYSLEEAQNKSLESDKYILIFAVTDWCVYCKVMDREAFENADIVSGLDQIFYAVRIDIESDRVMRFNGERMTESQFAARYRLTVPPSTLVLNSDGDVLFDYTGYISEEAFSQLLSAWNKTDS